MAHIKCRYTIPYCDYDLHVALHHDDYWFCDDHDDARCVGEYTRPSSAMDNVINPRCKYCNYYPGEFEKTVKQYVYTTDGDLRIGNKRFNQSEIEYLEIDGRILVDEE